jgi:GntR family transcriptional regulator, transcriptional repressor for pyruvate dehydrogenase complex
MGSPPQTSVHFTEARRVRSSDDIVSQIRDAIVEGRLRPGDRLSNERSLCRVFGVSRATLREGLRVLEALGVIEIRRGAAGGIFAREPQGDHVGAALEALLRFRGATAQELSEFRVSFEGETARWAAQRAEADDVARLEELAARFTELACEERVPWSVLVELDIAFHEALAHASKNQVRVAIMLGIHRALHQASSLLADDASAPVRSAIGAELHAIAEAVAAHDPDLAVERMRTHGKKFSELGVRAAAAGP